MTKIDVKLKMCTIYKEKPIGPALISYTTHKVESMRFEGIGIFTNGELHMGPFLCKMGDGTTN